ncbi:MAG: hypothetical protein HYX84_08060 [Chloroflexi bacterium]|nr:hypothetical protein [Chloroflexota bacterium]
MPPAHLDQWAQLMKELSPADFPAADFLDAALRLRHLEAKEGKTCEAMVEEYEEAKEVVAQLKGKIDSLSRKKIALNEELGATSLQLKELKSKMAERKSECLQLAKEVKELEKSKVKLSSEVNGKQESLARLYDLGFLDEDLLRLMAIIENIAKENGVAQEMVKEEFFITLGVFKDVIELEKCRTTEAEELGKLAGDRSVVTGEIAVLEERRDTLRNDIEESSVEIESPPVTMQCWAWIVLCRDWETPSGWCLWIRTF